MTRWPHRAHALKSRPVMPVDQWCTSGSSSFTMWCVRAFYTHAPTNVIENVITHPSKKLYCCALFWCVLVFSGTCLLRQDVGG